MGQYKDFTLLKKMSILKITTPEDSEESMDVENSNAENDLSDISSNPDDSESDILGNSAWADAMCRVLNTTTSKEKNFILSKAKKDTDVKKKDDVKKEEIEIVDESGTVLKASKAELVLKSKSFKEKRKEMLEKLKQKSEWELMCRVKPDITHKDRERELVRIATRGVVSLFNTVEKHQKSKKNPKERNAKKQEKLGAVKGNFMDILKGHSKRELKSDADSVAKKANQEETWSILKDDFMMGAEMKDWDKNSDDEK